MRKYIVNKKQQKVRLVRDSQEQTPRSHRSTGTENFPLSVWLEHTLRQFNGTWPKPTGHEADLRVKTASVDNLELVRCGGKAQPESHDSRQRRDRTASVQCTCCAESDCFGGGETGRFVVCPRDATSQNHQSDINMLDITVSCNYFCFNI